MNQKLCPVCNTVNTNTNKCVNCGNMFELPQTAPVITSNVLDNMPIASTIPISTVNNIAPPLSSLEQANNMPSPAPVSVVEPITQTMPTVEPIVPVQPVMPAIKPVAPVQSVSSATSTLNGTNQVLPQMQVLLGQEPTLAKQEVKQENNIKLESKFNLFLYVFKSFIKPYDEYKSNEETLSKPKNNLLIALVIILAYTVFSLFGTMISAVRETGFFSSDVTWVWSNLKNVPYIKHIFITFILYAVILYTISGVYFLAGLVMKKEVNFMKISSAVLTSFIPITLISVFINITSWFLPALLTILISVFAGIYSVLIFLELMNDQTKIENNNNKIYFNLSCISILFVLLILAMKVLTSI